MENNGKRFYLTIRGQEVEVSEEVYRAYIQPVRAERRRKQRAFRCKIKGKKGNLVRCQKDCRECPYALSGHNALGNNLSLDRMKDEGMTTLGMIIGVMTEVLISFFMEQKTRKLFLSCKGGGRAQ